MAVTVSRSNPAVISEANYIQVVAADTDNLPPSVGFGVDLDGTLSFKPRHNAALIEVEVLAGVFYPVDVLQVDITGSTTVTTVYLYQSIP